MPPEVPVKENNIKQASVCYKGSAVTGIFGGDAHLEQRPRKGWCDEMALAQHNTAKHSIAPVPVKLHSVARAVVDASCEYVQGNSEVLA